MGHGLKGDSEKCETVLLVCFLSFLDADACLHFGGCLNQTPLSDALKHPSILPKRHPVTQLIIVEVHESCGYLGYNYVLSCLWREFWLINGVSSVQHYLHDCVSCRVRWVKVCGQLMSELPAQCDAVDSYTFSCVTVDYFGHFCVMSDGRIHKHWGCVFTCMAMHAVHIMVSDYLAQDSFIYVYMRFLSALGQSQDTTEIFGNNGTNVKGASKVLCQAVTGFVAGNFCRELCNHGLT